METYKNLSGNSKIVGYTSKGQSITVHFTNGEVYEYSNRSAGSHHVSTMKLLAKAGYGLGHYIKEKVELGYARQLQ